MAEKIIVDANISVDKDGNALEYKTLVVHSAKYKTLYTEKYTNRKKWVKASDRHETSFIPGTILNLYVKEGDVIKKGQPLLILEAMKMENTIYAPFDGKIKQINVKEGDRIPKGVLMLEYE